MVTDFEATCATISGFKFLILNICLSLAVTVVVTEKFIVTHGIILWVLVWMFSYSMCRKLVYWVYKERVKEIRKTIDDYLRERGDLTDNEKK